MSFEQLRKLARVRQDAAEILEPDHRHSELDSVAAAVTHVPSVFYDQERFRSAADFENLRQSLKAEFSEQVDWHFEPAHAASLHGRIKPFSRSHTDQFQQHGYVAEITPPAFKSGPTQARSIRSQDAWDAFLVNTVVAEAIVYACRKLPLNFRERMIFKDPEMGVLVPMVGKLSEHDDPRATTVLYNRNGILFAPRGILLEPLGAREHRIAYPADPITTNTGSTSGRAVLERWTTDSRGKIRRRVEKEINAWARLVDGPNFIDAHLMFVAQTIGILRVQATEWKARERKSYVLSEANGRTKEDDVREEFQRMVGDLRDRRDNFVAPTIKRPPVTARADVISLLAGGIGLEDEKIWWDDQLHRDSLARQELGGLAQWIGELKRFHRAMLTGPLARLIDQILIGVPDTLQELELTNDDWSGPRLIRAQFPVAVWQGLLDAIMDPSCAGVVEVRYLWNKNPLEPARVLRKDDEGYKGKKDPKFVQGTVTIVGPMLDLGTERRAWWKDQAEQFRTTGSLTR